MLVVVLVRCAAQVSFAIIARNNVKCFNAIKAISSAGITISTDTTKGLDVIALCVGRTGNEQA